MQKKTTVYLDEGAYRLLKQIARADGRSPASMVREAVTEYTARRAPQRKARSVGAGHSGRTDLAQHDEELLEGFGDNR